MDGQPPDAGDGSEGAWFSARHSTVLPVNKVMDLSLRPDALGFRLGAWDYDLGGTSHIQGIARYDTAGGTPYLFVTTSGSPGKLLAVEMASRDGDGERMRSNRITPFHDTKDTPPPPEDRVVLVHELEWNHAGGAQVIDHYLIVAVEAGIGVNQGKKGTFMVYDVGDPRNMSKVYEHPDLGHKAGVVAITYEDDGHYLVMLGPSAYCGCDGTSWDNSNHYMRFFRSTLANDISGGFDYVNEWHADGDFNRQDNQLDPTYQTLNFVQDEVTGYLYVIGMWNSYVDPNVAGGDDFIDVFRVTETGDEYQVIKDAVVHRLHMNSKSADSQEQCNFIASGGVHISPGGELIIYSTTHYKETASSIDYIRVAEYRSIDVASAGSPLWGPRAVIDGPRGEVNEGDNVTLNASASTAQYVRGFVELFENDDFMDRRVIIDWDDFQDHTAMPGATWVDLNNVDGFGADADSMKFYLPPGSAIILGHKDWESNRLGLPLAGSPGMGVVSVPDLDGHRWKMLYNDVWYDTDDPMGDDIRFITFIGNGTVELDGHSWDLGDGSTATDSLVQHHAYLDDGMYEVGLTVHETDGDEASTNATVRVVNVPPAVTAGVDVVVDEDEEVGLNGSFIDPGVLDTHTLEWDLGDGTTVTDTLAPRHTYAEPGVYTVRLVVRDDDGGEGNDTLEVTVRDVTPPVAVSRGDGEIDQGDTVTFDGSMSHDNVGIASYRWTFLYDGQMETLEGETASFAFDVPGTYKVRLTVADAIGLEDFTDLVVTVADVNDPPVITSVPPPQLELTEDELVWLHIVAEDEEGGELTWTDDSDTFDVSPANGSIRFLPSQSDVGEHWINVTVTDAGGLSDTVTMHIIVRNVNDPPVITALLPTNGTEYRKGKAIAFTVNATDEDGDALTFTWKEGGVVLGTGTPFEYPKLGKGEHTITVVVDDGTTATEASIAVVVKEDTKSPGVSAVVVAASMVLAALVAESRNRQ